MPIIEFYKSLLMYTFQYLIRIFANIIIRSSHTKRAIIIFQNIYCIFKEKPCKWPYFMLKFMRCYD